MNDEWRKRLIRVRAFLLGPDFVVSWGGCRWNFNPAEEGLLWDEPAILQLLRHEFKQGDVFVDVGANVGGYAIRAARAGMVVDAFEPDPENRKRFTLNETLNQPCGVLNLFTCALGSEPGKAYLATQGSTSRIVDYSALAALIEYPEQVGKVEVQVRTLDEFALPRLDLMKVDVEGHELEVVRGSYQTLRRLRPKLLVEVHDSLDTVKQYILEGLLAEVGYIVTPMRNGEGKGISQKRYLWCIP